MNLSVKTLILFAGMGMLLLTTGCFETTEDFTINPDGSGKVTHECSFQPMNFGIEKETPEEAMRSAVKEVLQKSKGVEAWRDVSFKQMDDGKIFFRGTAYFKDLSKLNIPNQTMLEFSWKKNADGSAVLSLNTNKSTQPDGFTIQAKKQPASTNQLSPEEFAKKLKLERGKFQQAKPMLAGFLGTMKHAATLHLPGKVATSSNFTKDASGALVLRFDGAKLLEIMEKLVNDDEWCRRHSGTGFDNMQEKPAMDDEMNQLVFGTKGPVSATINGGTAPLFDFATEVAAAKKDFSKIEKELGVAVVPLAPPAQGQPLRKVEVVGAKLVNWSDTKQDLRPFHDDATYSLALLIELPGSILSITDESLIETAIDDQGTSLLQDSDWKRKIRNPQLSKDKAKAILELELKAPGKEVKGLKELSGTVQYKVSGGTKEVDLGIEELKADTKGTVLGARIEKIQEGWLKDGSQEMHLKLNLQPDDIKSLSMIVDGNKTVVKQSGYSGGGDSYTFTYTSKEAFPAKAHLIAEVYDKVQTFNVPFKLENITLLGASAK